MLRHPCLTSLSCLVFALVLTVVTSPARATGPTWHWPTASGQADLIRPFQAPLGRYGSGHRGIDLQVSVDRPITAPAPGVVLFDGLVARVPTLVLDHGGGLRSTYQPLTSELKVGDTVKVGQVIGTIAKGGRHCLPKICLHFGARNSAGYLDPRRLIRPTFPVLLPLAR